MKQIVPNLSSSTWTDTDLFGVSPSGTDDSEGWRIKTICISECLQNGTICNNDMGKYVVDTPHINTTEMT